MTPSPLLKAAKTLDMSGAEPLVGVLSTAGGGGAGPGGGGTSDPVSAAGVADAEKLAASPPRGFHEVPVV